MSRSKTDGTVTRRNVATSAAWAVPAVALVSAAPNAAASVPCVPTFSFGGNSCKCPGQSTDQSWGYYLQICATVNGCTGPGGATKLYIWDVTNNAKKKLIPSGASFPLVLDIGTGSACSTGYLLFNSESSASKIRFQYSFAANGSGAQWSSDIDAPPNCGTNASGGCLPPR
ncbi:MULTISPECIES: hypothetical protein [Dermacoccaceae]|uniref:Peptidase inhibitor family I36 n=2 Tax=Dermacoccaceae TaxID=145357 RepID=A0A542EK55_9MICO|nr:MULTISPECIES: hypothetical protein [Dermacoccaceae]REF30360.1 hypothetical protein DFJ65_1366 [Calidifontibacter indicus]TQJ15624.1 hypothetical protein FB459_3181 [Yimella lutea]